MEFAEVMKNKQRMCETAGRCWNCPIFTDNNGSHMSCEEFIRTYPEEAEEIIMKWAEGNPAKTNGDRFLEEFPDAYISTREYNSDDIEMVYVKPNLPSVNYCISFPAKWWDEEYKEVHKKCD